MSTSTNRRVLGVFTLTMINIAAIQSLRNLPIMAEVGWAAVFFYAVAGLGFFIPCSLVAAELSTGWPTRGVYIWVKEAFGPRWGFLAIWLQWIENVVWYPTILSFTAATIAYIFQPELAENKYYIMAMIFITYWSCTLIDFMGMKVSGMLSSIGVILGTLIPGVFIILLGAGWLASGQQSQIQFSWNGLLPDMNDLHNIVLLIAVLLGLSGMEMSAVHASEVKNPQRDYPRAIFLSCFLILAIYLMGSLAIAFVIPKGKISLVAGVMQAFSTIFETFNIGWITRWLAGFMALGSIATVATWIIGPSKGMLQTANEGHIPPIFQKRNRYGMPIAILITQGIVVTLISTAYLFMPNVSSSYWLINDLAALLYLIMYALMFMAAIRLRYKKPDVERTYRIPGGKTWGMWVVAGTGIIVCVFSIIIGFLPPSQFETGDLMTFELFLGCGVLLMVITPFILYQSRKEHWKNEI